MTQTIEQARPRAGLPSGPRPPADDDPNRPITVRELRELNERIDSVSNRVGNIGATVGGLLEALRGRSA